MIVEPAVVQDNKILFNIWKRQLLIYRRFKNVGEK